mgnify:CR=1 FL=1
MELRPATVADGSAIAEVRLALGPHHDDSGADAGYRSHLMDEGRLWVALDHGRVVAFAGTRDLGGVRLLSDLFVHPDHHGAGLGGRLLAAVMAGASASFTFASDDPRALLLYVRAGMTPAWPLVAVQGEAGLASGSGRAGCGSAAVSVVDADRAAAVESLLTGADRSVEHRYWSRRPGAVAMVGCVPDDSTAGSNRTAATTDAQVAQRGPGWVGVAVRHGDVARVEHLAVADGADPCHAFDRMLAALAVTRYEAHVPGPSPLLRHLLDRRGRVVDLDLHMASAPGLVPAQLHVIHPGLC